MTIDVLFLSPHLDDAALSCGGYIHQLTRSDQVAHVVTLFTGDPPPEPLSDFAAELHARWQLPVDTFALRREEDAKACAAMGVTWEHWDLPDCIYRRDQGGAPLYPTWADIIAGVHEADQALIETITRRLATLPKAGVVLAPLTVGGHADHRIVRRAAEACFGRKIWLYEDYPYAGRPGAVEAVVGTGAGWTMRLVELDAADLQAKCDAIRLYASQLSSLFEDASRFEEEVRGHVESAGGERHWRHSA